LSYSAAADGQSAEANEYVMLRTSTVGGPQCYANLQHQQQQQPAARLSAQQVSGTQLTDQ